MRMRFKSDEELLGKLSAELDHLDMLYADVTPPSLPEPGASNCRGSCPTEEAAP